MVKKVKNLNAVTLDHIFNENLCLFLLCRRVCNISNACIKHTGLKGNRATPLATADLYECRKSNMPAVLMECGFQGCELSDSKKINKQERL